jgi:hypothetical protein
LLGEALDRYGVLSDQLRSKLSLRLFNHFNGSHFGSTFESAQTLIHGRWLLEHDLASRAAGRKPTVRIDGKDAMGGATRVTQRLAGWLVELDPKYLHGGRNAVAVEADSVYGKPALKVVTKTPLEQSTEIGEGWTLKKSYFKVDEKSGALTELPPNDPKVAVGDLIYVKIDFHPATARPRKWWASRYYVLTDDVPAGFSVVEEDRAYEAAPFNLYLRASEYRMRHLNGSNVRWYYSFERGWMDNGRSVGYLLRANYAGTYATGVARVEDFYDETSFAQTASRRLAVAPQFQE